MFTRVLILAVAMTAVSCTSKNSDRPASNAPAAAESETDAKGAEDAAPPRGDWTAEYDAMSVALELSEDEQAALRAAFLAREEEVSAWMSGKGVQLVELEKKMSDAAKAQDLAGVRQATSQAKPLRSELRELIKSHQEAIVNALSADNQHNWAAHELAQRLCELMEPLELTEEQISQIHAESHSAVQASVNETNPSAAGFLKLEQAAEAGVLTLEQRQAYGEMKRQNPMRSL